MKRSSLPLVDTVLTNTPTVITSNSQEIPTTQSGKNNSTLCEETTPTEAENLLIETDIQPNRQSQPSIWGIFSSTFLTIFLAEMGDKTQLSTLLIAAESQSPWLVFAGAAIALISTSLLGVLLGCWLSQRVSPKTMERSAGILLLFISVMLLWDVLYIS